MLYGQIQVSADQSEEPHVSSPWAQIKNCGAIAHLQQDLLGGSAKQINPTLSSPPEVRIASVTGSTTDLDRRLQHLRFARQRDGAESARADDAIQLGGNAASTDRGS
jgi:hypothetical protein